MKANATTITDTVPDGRATFIDGMRVGLFSTDVIDPASTTPHSEAQLPVTALTPSTVRANIDTLVQALPETDPPTEFQPWIKLADEGVEELAWRKTNDTVCKVTIPAGQPGTTPTVE